jgi:hypothetical protein
MNKPDVSIATMTWARSAGEERLLRESLPSLAGLGVPVFATDGGSGEGFLGFMRRLPNFHLVESEGTGPWPQVRRSLRAAQESGAGFIFYTEPDKADFFRAGLREFFSEGAADAGAGVVLASRSPEAFSTFPEFQRAAESSMNRCCEEVTGRPGDYSYGPFLINREILPSLYMAGDDVGWGWRHYAFGVSSRVGYRVEHLLKGSPCPAGQREEGAADRIYRMRQLSDGLRGLLLSTAISVPGKGGQPREGI